MDKIVKYRELIKGILSRHAELVSRQLEPGEETLLAFDEEHDQYIWLQLGWTKRSRTHGITLHVRLRDGKIWVEEDWTEDGIATELLRAGVPNEDIVLGFHAPEMRPYTEFAVA
jgi:hypothetical protein